MLHLNIKWKLSSGSTLHNGQMTSLVPCNQGTLPLRPALTRRRIWVRIFGTKSGLSQVRDQINNAVVWLGPRGGDLGMVVAVWGGLCRCCVGVLGVPCGAAGALAGVLGTFWFWGPVEWLWAVFPRGSCLFSGGGGLVDHFLWVC